MNWINNVVRPKIRSFLTTKREVPDNLWIKCPESGQMVFYKDLEANQFVVPGSDYHMRMASDVRLQLLFDGGQFARVPIPSVPLDPLKFRDGKKRYTDRLRDAKAETNLEDAVLVGEGKLDGMEIVAAAQDFRFMAGSLGMAAGEGVIAGMLRAVEKKTPFILFAASGGARMQEGILSLMQMPRTTIAVERLREAGLPYIVVLTDPTTGGVTASYAMLGDIHIAEPGALICFAGPRVIQQTIRENLPEGFQRAEYLLAHGMIDMVVHRHQMRETLSRICHLLMHQQPSKHVDKKKLNGKTHLNGNASEAHLITTRTTTVQVIEPEIVEPEERFDPARIEHHESEGGTEEATKRSLPKDRQH
ncbi:acetyl-CoA carboxylase, carboxyltransferase subunit beta [Hyphomicrobium sp. NDB2Meth4]|uniref:acetyl-CoA carboxylase, carboxyltransferase subunit beta n=1 Tax=Hyphomicrobium sp. NDB2Meth4 TaxID=1892846 RepID=UPI0009316E59|nr:acetyl-CoA carboxylase, carboxyltransferase subunit beta [Hyphomicrobium sp. NDB2Meth4]